MKPIRFRKKLGEIIPQSGSIKTTMEGLSDGDWEVEFRKQKKPKSMEQLGYLRGGIVPFIASELGYIIEGMSKEDIRIICQKLYEAIRNRHLKLFGHHWEKDLLSGKRKKIQHTLRDGDSEICRKFIDAILKDEMFVNMGIPAPDDKRALLFWQEQIDRFGTIRF